MTTPKRFAGTRRVFMTPDYRSANPYQALLARSLANHDICAGFPAGYRRGLPLNRSIGGSPMLHLHWLAPFVKGRSRAVRAFYARKLLADLALLKARGRRIVWTVHNLAAHDTPDAALDHWLRHHVARLADACIVHSESARDAVARAFDLPAGSIHVVHHGHYRDAYSTPPPRAQARAELDLPAGSRLFLHLGMLRPYKGIESLFDAWDRARLADATLLVAGKPSSSSYKTRLTCRVAEIPSARLHSRFIPDSRIPLYFAAADVVVLPFARSLTSGSLMLALSFAKPVIAPAFPQFSETLGEAGTLAFQPADPTRSLAESLARAASAPLEPISRLTAARCDTFDWPSAASLTANLYHSLS